MLKVYMRKLLILCFKIWSLLAQDHIFLCIVLQKFNIIKYHADQLYISEAMPVDKNTKDTLSLNCGDHLELFILLLTAIQNKKGRSQRAPILSHSLRQRLLNRCSTSMEYLNNITTKYSQNALPLLYSRQLDKIALHIPKDAFPFHIMLSPYDYLK